MSEYGRETAYGFVRGLKFATPRDPNYPSLGPAITAFARIWLRIELMPLQKLMVDVAGEYDPETGRPRYGKVLDLGPRRAGKTHLAMAKNGFVAMRRPSSRLWFTQQTGQDAARSFLKFCNDTLGHGPENPNSVPLTYLTKLGRGRGDEKLTFANASEWRPHPPSEEKLHGEESDANDIDEAWYFSKDAGQALMQAIAPTQLTRPHAQTWIHSAGGTPESTWLAEEVADGRKQLDPTVAYFETGIPDTLTDLSPETVAQYHPAFGHTIDLAGFVKLRSQLKNDAEWCRAAGNRWTEIVGGAVPADVWRSVQWSDPIPDGVPVAYGAARAHDGSQVVIAAAAQLDGFVVVEILEVLPTSYLAAKHVKGWAGSAAVGINPSGPSAGLADDLAKERAKVITVKGETAAAATTQILDGLPHRSTRFRPHPALDSAIAVAKTAPGGAWTPSTEQPIAAIEAATWAVWAVTHRKTGIPISRPPTNGAAQ